MAATLTELTARAAELTARVERRRSALASARHIAKRRDCERDLRWAEDDLREVTEALVAARAAAPAPAAPVSVDSRRRNRYPGTCECGRHVAAGAGFIENDGGWLVFCGTCGLSSTVG